MNREEALSSWAPADSPWSRWTKAVLFGFMPEEIPDVPASASGPWWVPSDPGTALLVELAGARGVEFGAALARSGYRPVPLYNACPFPINVFSVPNFSSVVEVVPIMRALERETSTLKGLALPPSVPPAFLLDASRRRPASRPEVGWYDNRSVVRPSDVPTATFLKERGIRQVTVVQAEPNMQSDLRTVLLAWQEGGLNDFPTGAVRAVEPTGFHRHQTLAAQGLVGQAVAAPWLSPQRQGVVRGVRARLVRLGRMRGRANAS